MVLSNKRLKQKLRAAKAELMAAAEAQNQSTNVDSENPDSKTPESIKTLLNSISQKSKRAKHREKAQSLSQVSSGDLKPGRESDDGLEEEKVDDSKPEDKKEKKNRKKRKRSESEGLESGEVKKEEKSKKKKKKKKKQNKKKKAEKKVENGNTKQDGDADGEQVAEAVNCSKEDTEVSTKVYAGGIPYYSTEDDIRSFFEGCGTITEIDCMKFPESGKFRGIAIISFKTEAAAKRALALDGSDMGGLFLKIQPYKSARVNKVSNFSPKPLEGYNRIYVGNLSWDITEDDLRKLFSDCTVTSVRFGEDKETGEFKGYAHVDFADSRSLNIALNLDQKVVCGRPVRISCAVPKKGGNPKSKPLTKSNQVDTKGVSTANTNQADSNGARSTVNTNQADSNGASAVSSKIRRRTCYECGERGHLSSSCPKKQTSEQASPASS